MKDFKLNTVQWGIVVLALATGLIHLVVLNMRMMQAGMGISMPFLMNGLGFLGLLAAYFLPLPIAKDNRPLVRWAFIAFSALTIIAWAVITKLENPEPLAIVTKLIEAGLIALLWIDRKG